MHRGLMARTSKINCMPDDGRNYSVVDACFLANRLCNDWWDEIDKQLSDLGGSLLRVVLQEQEERFSP